MKISPFIKENFFSTFSFVLIAVFAITVSFKSNYSRKHGWEVVIQGDGKGYYYYLPSIFLKEKAPVTESFFNTINGKVLNKYFCGEAILLFPFFAAAYIACIILGIEVNGYYSPFQFSVSLAAIFYLLIGLFYLRKFLKLFHIKDIHIALALIFISLGTNLFYYSVEEPSASHVYSFFAITVFLYFSKRLFVFYHLKDLIICSVLLGIITVLRPYNFAIILLLPFFGENPFDFLDRIKLIMKNKSALILSVFLFFCLIFIQSWLFYQQTGEFIVYSYAEARFKFDQPHTANFLFSFRKGLFVYSPVVFISTIGLIPVFKQNRYKFFALFLFLTFIIFTLSCWCDWYFGDSFGMRPMIDFYAIFALLLSLLLKNMKPDWLKLIIVFILTICLFLNLVQTYQYKEKILHPNSMDKEKYLYTFLKTDKKYKGILAGTNDIPYRDLKEKPLKIFFNGFESDPTYNSNKYKTNQSHSGLYVNLIDSSQKFNKCFLITNDQDLKIGSYMYLKASVWKFEPKYNAAAKALLILTMDSANGKNYCRLESRINEVPRDPGRWYKTKFNFQFPIIRNKTDIITICVSNPEKTFFYIDDLILEFYELK